ncbi:MAG: hypothetical protein NTW28_09990, partial [Candidatus Solibacter sp.]|nr:hypothetical protein [Candidatus Solibacter sp.]
MRRFAGVRIMPPVFGILQKRWCVRLVRSAGGALLVGVSVFYLVHTSPVRMFVLGWMGPKLSRTAGLTLRAQTLEYNLAKGWVQLGSISAGPDGSPALLRAKSLAVHVPVLDLLRGEFRRAQITADAVRIHLERGSDGRWNLPMPPGEPISAGTIHYFHSLRIADLSLMVADDSTGTRVELPQGHLDATWQATQYRVEYRTRQGRLHAGDFAAPLDDVILTAGLGAEAVVLERLSIAAGNSAVSIDHARLALAGLALDATGSAVIDTAQFDHNTAGLARAVFSVSGTASAPAANVRITSEGVRTAGRQVGAIALTAQYQKQKVELIDASARMFGARVGVRGAIDFSGPQPNTRATARVDGIAVDRLLGDLGLQVPHPIRGTAHIEATCAGADWRKGRLSGVLRIAPTAALSIQARMEGQRVAVRIDSDRADEVNASGTVWLGTTDRSLRGTLSGHIPSIRRAGQYLGVANTPATLPIDGALDWQVNLGGSVSNPKLAFTAGSANLSLPTVKAATLHLDGSYENSALRLNQFLLRSGEQELLASGTLGAGSHVQFDGTLKGIAMGDLLGAAGGVRDVSGTARGEFSVRGTLSQPEANVTAAIGGLTAYGRTLGSLDAVADFRDGVISVARLHLEQPRKEGFGKLDASGSVTLAERRFQFTAKGNGLRIDDPAVRGDVNFEAEGKGTFENPEGKLVAEASQLVTEALPIGRVNAEITYADHRAIALLTAPDLNASAHAAVQVNGEYPVDFEISSTGTRVRTARYFESTISGWLEGSASGRATLGTAELQSASVNLRNAEVEVDGYKVEAGGPVQADYKNGRLSLAPVTLIAPAARIQVAGTLPLEADQPPGKISITGTVRMDEALKKLGLEGGGEIKIDAAIAGSARKWEPELNLTLENGSFEEKSLGLEASQVGARARIADGVLRLEGLTGKFAGGDVSASASLPLHLVADRFSAPVADPGQPVRWSLATRQTEFQIGGLSGAGVTFSLRSTGEAPRLSLADLKGVVEFDELSLRGKHGEMKQAQQTRVTVDHSVARLAATELRDPNATLRISGTSTLSADPIVDIQVAGETDASVLALVSPTLDAAGR